jgi:hypothetical protein
MKSRPSDECMHPKCPRNVDKARKKKEEEENNPKLGNGQVRGWRTLRIGI